MALPTILAIASVLGLLTLVGACRRHRTPGAWWLAVFAAALTWWDVWSVLELATDDFAQMVLASKIEYVGIAVLPVAWLQLGARLRGDGRRLPARVWYLLAPVAILVPLLAATNDLHHLVWANIYQLPIGSSPKAVYEHGPAWFAIVGWTYVLLTWGTVLLVRAGLSWRRQDRAKAWLLIGAVLVPWIANVAYAANLLPVPGLEPTPVALTVTAALLLVGLDRLRLLDLTPIAADVLLANLSDALLVIDDAGCVVHANPAARTLGLLRLEGKLGLPAAEVCAGWLALAPRLVERDWRAEIQVQGAGGAPLTLEVRGLNLEAKHGQVGHLLVAADITARKRAEDALAVLALHDGLTGLANRTLLYDRLEQAIRVGEREQRPFALLVLDLDRFKDVNDSLGHLAGDRLLCEVADRLRRLLRAEDTVARLGGDEFAVILPGANAPGGATVAANIVAGLAEPFDLEQHRVRIGASVGVAVFPDHGCAGEQLVRCADLAMYVAKRGGDGHVIYQAVFAERSIDQVMLTA